MSNINAFVFAPTQIVFADATNVFFFQDYHSFSVLQSSIHTVWLEEYASTMKTDIRYTPATCFDTLALPVMIERATQAGYSYYDFRQKVQQERSVGLTGLYNLLYDESETSEDIQELRQLHVEMDHAVAAAYGWSDLDLGHGYHQTKQGLRYTISEAARREVLGRLLKLNHERYAEEVAKGLHEKKKGSAARGRKKAVNTQQTAVLFNDEEDA